MISDILAEGVLETLRKRSPQLARRADGALEWIRDAAAPPEGVEIRSRDGAVFSGLFIIERNRPVFALAVRHPIPDHPPTPLPIDRSLRTPELGEVDHWGPHHPVRR